MASIINPINSKLCKFCLAFMLLNLPIYAAFAKNALVIRGTNPSFDKIVKSLNDELESEVSLYEMMVKKGVTIKKIEDLFTQDPPKIVILIGNKAVNLYAKFQEKRTVEKFPPAIAIAALFVDTFVDKLENTTAIRYEIPAVISAVAMRTILGIPVKKLGVIHRDWMSDIIEENRRFCKAEGIELIAIKLPNKARKMEEHVKNALNQLNKQVDALWILNDNALLTSNALLKAWLPSRAKSKLPAIVGIRQFLTKIPLGSFAIVPDHYGLGEQAAGIVFEIMENNWQLANIEIQQPVSVNKFISTANLDKKGINYLPAKLNQVDEIIK